MKTIYYTHAWLMSNIESYPSYFEMCKDQVSISLNGHSYSYWEPKTVGANLERARINQAVAGQYRDDIRIEQMAYERDNFEHTTLIRFK